MCYCNSACTQIPHENQITSLPHKNVKNVNKNIITTADSKNTDQQCTQGSDDLEFIKDNLDDYKSSTFKFNEKKSLYSSKQNFHKNHDKISYQFQTHPFSLACSSRSVEDTLDRPPSDRNTGRKSRASWSCSNLSSRPCNSSIPPPPRTWGTKLLIFKPIEFAFQLTFETDWKPSTAATRAKRTIFLALNKDPLCSES